MTEAPEADELEEIFARGRRTVRARCFKSGFDVQMCPVIEDLHVDEELVELDD